MIKGRCRKCGKLTYVYKHHPLPQAIFGKGKNNLDQDTVELCGNCHTDYHQFLGKKELSNPDAKFHYKQWYTWFYLMALIGIVTVIISCF